MPAKKVASTSPLLSKRVGERSHRDELLGGDQSLNTLNHLARLENLEELSRRTSHWSTKVASNQRTETGTVVSLGVLSVSGTRRCAAICTCGLTVCQRHDVSSCPVSSNFLKSRVFGSRASALSTSCSHRHTALVETRVSSRTCPVSACCSLSLACMFGWEQSRVCNCSIEQAGPARVVHLSCLMRQAVKTGAVNAACPRVKW